MRFLEWLDRLTEPRKVFCPMCGREAIHYQEDVPLNGWTYTADWTACPVYRDGGVGYYDHLGYWRSAGRRANFDPRTGKRAAH